MSRLDPLLAASEPAPSAAPGHVSGGADSEAAIAIIVPMLRRPHRVAPLAANLAEVTHVPYKIIFVCSEQADQDAVHAIEREHPIGTLVTIKVPEYRLGYASKINLGYRQTDEPYLLLGADDLRFHRGWDIEALAVAEATGAGVVGTNDLGNRTVIAGKHSTHPLVARRYADERGTVDQARTVVSEVYEHNWVDTELVETAKARGEWAFAPRSLVEHEHPFWGKNADDDVYRLGRKHYAADARLYRRRQKLWLREKAAV